MNLRHRLSSSGRTSFFLTFLGALVFFCFLLGPSGFASGGSLHGEVKVYAKNGQEMVSPSNVVIFIDIVDPDKYFEPPGTKPKIAQIDQQFRPEVLPVTVGTTVEFPNDDTIFHNVFSRSKTKPFDLGMYQQGQSKSVTFTETGLVQVFCNIHSHMVSYVLILNNPYFAVTDQFGFFEIPNVPPGNYTVRAWQRFGPSVEEILSVREGEEKRVDFKLVQQKVSMEHKNKYGKDYDENSSLQYT